MTKDTNNFGGWTFVLGTILPTMLIGCSIYVCVINSYSGLGVDWHCCISTKVNMTKGAMNPLDVIRSKSGMTFLYKLEGMWYMVVVALRMGSMNSVCLYTQFCFYVYDGNFLTLTSWMNPNFGRNFMNLI